MNIQNIKIQASKQIQASKLTQVSPVQGQTEVPSDYGVMHRMYFAGTHCLAYRLAARLVPHGTSQDWEDLAAAAMTRAIQHKILEGYDASKANFGGVVYFLVRSVCVNYLRYRTHDPIGNLRRETVVHEEGEERDLLLEVVDSKAPYVEDILTKEEVFRKVEEFSHTRTQIGANKRDRSVEELVGLIKLGAEPEECAQKLGVSIPTIKNWTNYLVENTFL